MEDKTTIEDCYFTGKPIWNLISCPKKSKLVFNRNNVNLVARAMIVGVTNGSKITYNTINLQKEKFDENNRTGVLSVTAIEKGEGVTIENNTFENANRAIGVDHSSLEGEKLTVKNNNFINTQFAFEIDTRTETNDPIKKPLNNRGKKYDLSKNYYKYGNNPASAPKVQDADSHLEVKEDANVPLDFVVGPYYTTEDKNESAHAGVAAVNGKDYPTLEKAINVAKNGSTVEEKTVRLVSDINAETLNQIWNVKGIIIDGAGTNGKKHTIKVNKIESLDNHDAIFHSLGGNTFKNLKIDLSGIKELGNAQGIRAISAANNDEIENVEILGNKFVSYGIVASEDCENLKISKSNISNCTHGIYFATEGSQNGTNIEVVENEFTNCEFASVLHASNVDFSNNKLNNSPLNIVTKTTKVVNNKFSGNSKVEFYAPAEFKQNTIEQPNDSIEFMEKGILDSPDMKLSKNYWGTSSPNFNKIVKGDYKLTPEQIDKFEPYYLESCFNNEDAILQGENISKPIKPSYDHNKIIGSDRYYTAAKIADKLGSYDNVVLVNATSTMSDGLSASGLAGKEKGAILLTKKDSIPKVTMDRLKKVKKVYIIGGENAISAKVANEITAAGIKVERIGGKNRVETSELVAKKLGNYKKAFVVNGFKGEADAMSASSVAAKNGAPILLTNGKTSTHDKKSGVKYYVVGGNNVVNKSIANKYNAEVLAGDDRYETNREVINEFYGESETLYFANGETLVDALTASTLSKDDGLVLVGRKSDNKILNKKNTIQVGGIKFSVDFEK